MNTPEQVEKVVIEVAIVNNILEYLSKRPFIEVNTLIAQITQGAQNLPEPDKMAKTAKMATNPNKPLKKTDK